MNKLPLSSEIDAILEECLLDPGITKGELSEIKKIDTSDDKITIPDIYIDENSEVNKTLEQEDVLNQEEQIKNTDLRALISKMRLPEKIKMALFGNATARTLLIRDAQKIVQMAVLKNPKLNPREVEDYAKNPNLSEHVLRFISASPTWSKHYNIKLCLVENAKTPQDISLKWLRYLNVYDLKKISKSRSVPQLIANTAKKRLTDLEQR